MKRIECTEARDELVQSVPLRSSVAPVNGSKLYFDSYSEDPKPLHIYGDAKETLHLVKQLFSSPETKAHKVSL